MDAAAVRARRHPRAAVPALVVVLVAAGAASGAGYPRAHVDPPAVGGRSPGEHAVPAAGDPGSYRFLATQPHSTLPVTWAPCAVVEVVVDPRGGPPHWRGLLHRTLGRVGTATGLRFRDAGTTRQRDFFSRGASVTGARPPVLVGWADEDEVPGLAGAVAGLGAPTSVTSADGRSTYVSGSVVLDTADFSGLAGHPGRAAYAEAVLAHELGHLAGLDHTTDRDQLMYASSTGRTTYGAGDLAGFAHLGGRGCD